MSSLVLYANDIRIKDHQALTNALKHNANTHACFIFFEPSFKKYGGRRNQFFMDSLQLLEKNLAHLGIPFHILEARNTKEAEQAFEQLLKNKKISSLFFHEPIDDDDKKLFKTLIKNREHESFIDQTLFRPGQVLNNSHEPFKVFTPFCRKFSELLAHNKNLLHHLNAPKKNISRHAKDIRPPSWLELQSYDKAMFPPGEKTGLERLKNFISHDINNYAQLRDYFGEHQTSRLSPYLCVGLLSQRMVLSELFTTHPRLLHSAHSGAHIFFTEIVWREFYRHLWNFFPDFSQGEPFRKESKNIQWRHSSKDLLAWQQGTTGIPIVDAAMRAFNQTGFMHNRLRMITASFLSKNLLIDWHEGERYFMRNLIDADVPSNNGGWQWSASVGVDPQPYFRIFNPVLQSQRYDPSGNFIRKFVPELSQLEDKSIHAPFSKMSDAQLQQLNYCVPICDLSSSRAIAIEAFKSAFKKLN
ncbi:MAG: deoxyribodipyrimidine photo-lyase [Myxococcales bacterium]|nr:deoxyribodipyrimidine photo-lyase [Myxococcales bacterium]USN51221.1 MAG: deoxyribodipyrimidine photo-lyase [Myxococcales bacterium]